jgi:hypothetical protein
MVAKKAFLALLSNGELINTFLRRERCYEKTGCSIFTRMRNLRRAKDHLPA